MIEEYPLFAQAHKWPPMVDEHPTTLTLTDERSLEELVNEDAYEGVDELICPYHKAD